ncbi:MAG: response regulator transcription factor [Oligoflexia bacterium]|nr:response regulator transcription factor [Oligoflexia bacterium]
MDQSLNNPQVLVVEDEKDVRDLMLLHLNREGLRTIEAEDGESAIKLIQNNDNALIILDWMLPGVSGLEICKRVRQLSDAKSQVPILMVTARADAADMVLGLEMGADDYVTKPFEISIFLARVRALLRRAKSLLEPKTNKQHIGNLTINVDAHEVTCASIKVDLTPSEFKLLSALTENRGRVLSRENLIKLVQGQGVAVIDRTVDTHIFGLRKKLGDCADVVETIRGIGYRIRS